MISDSLREQLGVPAWRSGYVAAIVHCRQTEEFMDGLFNRLMSEEERTRALQIAVEVRDERMEELNSDIAQVGRVTAICRGCGEHREVDYDIKDFTRDNHYCGRDPHCCP